MSSRSEFIVTYDGPALEHSEMDARDLSPALLAVSDLVDRANEIFNDNRAQAKVVVRGSFKTGSFGIDLGVVTTYTQAAVDFFSSDAVTAAETILGILGFFGISGVGVINVIKRLRGRPIKRVVQRDDNKVDLVVDDEHIETEYEVLQILRDPDARKALEKAIYEPLEKEGIDTFAVQESSSVKPLIITKEERHWFRAPPDPTSEVLSDDITEEHLQLVSVAFRDDNKWRVSDGVSTFYAAMIDPDFNRQVELGQARFSANDLLFVKLLRRRYLDGHGKLKTEAQILEVLQHRPGARQYSLGVPLSEDDDPGEN